MGAKEQALKIVVRLGTKLKDRDDIEAVVKLVQFLNDIEDDAHHKGVMEGLGR